MHRAIEKFYKKYGEFSAAASLCLRKPNLHDNTLNALETNVSIARFSSQAVSDSSRAELLAQVRDQRR